MLDLAEKGEPVDLVTVTSDLQDHKWLDDIGGVAYLSDLANAVPTAANVEYYSRIVEEKSILRRLIKVATNIAAEGYASEEEVDTILVEAEKTILDVSQRKNTSAFISIKDVSLKRMIRSKCFKIIKAKLQGFRQGLLN